MLRRGIVLLGVLLLGVAILVSQTSCRFFPEFEIAICDGPEGPIIVQAPFTVCLATFGSTKTSIQDTWDMGDGTVLVGWLPNVTHTYAEVGEYQVHCEVVYDDGSTNRDSVWVAVAGEPDAVFDYRPISTTFSFAVMLAEILGGDAMYPTEEGSLRIEFDARASHPTSDARVYRPWGIEWDFGDGHTDTIHVRESRSSRDWRDMLMRHDYEAAGTYTVTLTIHDNLQQTVTTTQTITVGTPSAPDDDEEEDLADQFTLVSSDWELDDEEEEGCLSIYGSVNNAGPLAAGVELTATAYAGAVAVGTITHWPAGSGNILAGADMFYAFFLCNLSVPAEQVTGVEVVITDGTAF